MDSINLRAKPFYLDEDAVRWVNDKLQRMSKKEKVGQLFFPLGISHNRFKLTTILNNIKPSGILFRANRKSKIYKTHRFLQNKSEIPMFIAANLESGGDGAVFEGTIFARQMAVAATGEEEMAYRLGLVAGKEGKAIGCNLTFSPVVDIDMNFLNPITNIRTYGSDTERVIRMSKAYINGVRESGLAIALKHWPGDGVDQRDHHLLASCNSLSVKDWYNSFGRVYKELIDFGAEIVMAGHITLPALSNALSPGIRDKDIKPASLAPELNYKLLREELNFNGVIISDATLMTGFNQAGKRKDLVPETIAAGCDIFLFNRDLEEDFGYMFEGLKRGVLTEDRLNDAVTRILALKATLKLHRRSNNTFLPSKKSLKIIGCEEHGNWARICAEKSITLVKDTQNLLPISPQQYKKVLYIAKGDAATLGRTSIPFGLHFYNLLRKEGFHVDLFKVEKVNYKFLTKPIKDFLKSYNIVIYCVSEQPYSNKGSNRLVWAPPLGFDCPSFVEDIPTIMISFGNPYHLYDAPMIKTLINAYTPSNIVQEEVMNLLLGRKEFKGKNPIDPFCGVWDTGF
jgi:beta-N-acetylhexosaminidase